MAGRTQRTKRAEMMVHRGERDGMLAVLRTSEAEEFCSFPDEPLVQDKWVLFVRAADIGKLKFSSMDDLVGHDVAIHEPSFGGREQPTELWKFLREHHNLVETNGSEESIRMLEADRIDYAVVNLAFGMNIIARMGLSGQIEPLQSRDVIEEGVYVRFTKTRVDPAFVGAFSQALKQFKQTDASQAIYRKYYP